MTDELLLLRELLEKYCAGGNADVPLHDAEALLRRVAAVLERLSVLPAPDDVGMPRA
jgi:hypothetical protein